MLNKETARKEVEKLIKKYELLLQEGRVRQGRGTLLYNFYRIQGGGMLLDPPLNHWWAGKFDPVKTFGLRG